jgi:hypothetical protein
LTQDIAKRLEGYWRMSGLSNCITDEQICDIAGIRFDQLRGWLQRNRKPKATDGTYGSEGLRDIRSRAKAQALASYSQWHLQLTRKAEAAGDIRTALQGVQWMMEKQFPKQFGRLAGEDAAAAPEARARSSVFLLPATMTTEEYLRLHPPLQPEKT